MRRGANWFALIWAVLIGGFLLFGPVYGTATSSIATSPADHVASSVRREPVSLAASEGLWGYVLLALPVVLAGVPLLVASRRVRMRLNVALGVFVGMFALLGMASIGLFYVPVAIALILAVLAESPEEAAG